MNNPLINQEELRKELQEFTLDIWHLALDYAYGSSENRSRLVASREEEFLSLLSAQQRALLTKLEEELGLDVESFGAIPVDRVKDVLNTFKKECNHEK